MNLIKITTTIILGKILLACSPVSIIYKPSKHMDPLPILADSEEAKSLNKSIGLDPMAKDQWALSKVGLTPEELNKNLDLKGNFNIKVAVLSTGVDYNHKDLVGQIHINRDEISTNGLADKQIINRQDDDKNGLIDDVVGFDVVDNDGFAYDRHGAGTAVAGIIAARANNSEGVVGLMKEVTLYPIRYINENGQTNLANLIRALDVALASKPDVVFVQQIQFQMGGNRMNPGQGAAELSVLKSKLNELKDRKVPVIVGAGEDIEAFGTAEIDKVLREFDNIIVVSSSDKDDELAFLAKHSFTGVHTVAPGEDILTTQMGDTYGKVHGTAYAAAHVTAAVALAKAKFGDKKSSQEIISALISQNGGDYIKALDRFSRGGNRLNIVKLLASLDK